MNEEKQTPSMSWLEIADLTHETQVSNFGFCSCEDNEGRPNPYEDCPSDNPRCGCAKPNAKGWHIADDAGITFGTLKQAQNESAREIAEYIAHIFFTKTETAFNDLMKLIIDGKHPDSFRELCEWQANYTTGEFKRVGDTWECCDGAAIWHDCDLGHSQCFVLVCEYCGNFDRDCEERVAK